MTSDQSLVALFKHIYNPLTYRCHRCFLKHLNKIILHAQPASRIAALRFERRTWNLHLHRLQPGGSRTHLAKGHYDAAVIRMCKIILDMAETS